MGFRPNYARFFGGVKEKTAPAVAPPFGAAHCKLKVAETGSRSSCTRKGI